MNVWMIALECVHEVSGYVCGEWVDKCVYGCVDVCVGEWVDECVLDPVSRHKKRISTGTHNIHFLYNVTQDNTLLTYTRTSALKHTINVT